MVMRNILYNNIIYDVTYHHCYHPSVVDNSTIAQPTLSKRRRISDDVEKKRANAIRHIEAYFRDEADKEDDEERVDASIGPLEAYFIHWVKNPAVH